jgi:hypothetical protein
MAPQTENILLIVGFIVIALLSFIIEKRVSNQLSPKIGVFTYAVIGLVCLFYLIDVLAHVDEFLQDKYFYFWFAVLLVQLGIFVLQFSSRKNKQN